MGTLTGTTPLLEQHCPHKLPSSCRLTATPDCCACQDKRPHSATYRIYVDGVGFVPRGTRWHNYCWFCREFWNNRVEQAPPPYRSRPELSRIPEIPDQTGFLERWYEFHRGYRIIERDGVQERQAVTGEPWKEVSPGRLPRTLTEMRAGLEMSQFEVELGAAVVATAEEGEEPQQPQQSLEDMLDEWIDEADSDGDDEHAGPETHGNPTNLLYSSPAPLPELETERPLDNVTEEDPRIMQALIILGAQSVSRNYPERLPGENPSEHASRLATAIENARRVLTLAHSVLTRAQDDVLFLHRHHHHAVENERRAQNLAARVFGTREDIERDDYESPVSGLFRRAWEYHRRVQELRRQEAEQADAPGREGPLAADFQSVSPEADFSASPPVPVYAPLVGPPAPRDRPRPFLENSLLETLEGTDPFQAWEEHRNQLALRLFPTSQAPVFVHTPDEPQGLDIDDDRPEPKTDEELTLKLECKVCYTQRADTVFLPCGHMSLCKWCADQHCPGKESDNTASARPRRCPVCRKWIRRKVLVYV